MINYAKKPDRDYYYDYIEGPHEGRFESINKDPEVLSRHIAIPRFERQSKRKPLFLSSARYPVDYRIEGGERSPDPVKNEGEGNRAVGRLRNLSQGIQEFSKMSRRKELNPKKPF